MKFKMKPHRNKIKWIFKQYLLLLLLKISFDFVYFEISKLYSYSGFVWNPVAYKIFVSWLAFLVIVPSIIKLYDDKRISSTVVLFINLIYFIPGLTLYAYAGLQDIYIIFFIAYWVLLMAWSRWFPRWSFKISERAPLNFSFYWLITGFVIGAIIITGYYNDFSINLSLANVYDLRMKQRAMDLPTIVGYIQPAASVIFPLGIVWFLHKKSIGMVIFLAFAQLLLFSFGGSKTTLFLMIAAVLGYFLYSDKRVHLITQSILGLNIIAVFELLCLESYSILALLQRRVMFVPNQLSSYYFEFFSTNNPDMLAQSFLRHFGVTSNYNTGIARLIGQVYYGNIETNANNGMIGDAFCNFGWFSLLIYPFIIVIALRFMEACSFGIDNKLLFIIVLAYSLAFINVSFFSVMLTNGFIIMCVILLLLPRENEELKNIAKRV